MQIKLLSKLRKNYLTGKMSKGIANFQIETALKNISYEDLNDNCVSVFPTNELNRFIDYKSMISGKSANILS